jgi:hypothetical protein
MKSQAAGNRSHNNICGDGTAALAAGMAWHAVLMHCSTYMVNASLTHPNVCAEASQQQQQPHLAGFANTPVDATEGFGSHRCQSGSAAFGLPFKQHVLPWLLICCC